MWWLIGLAAVTVPVLLYLIGRRSEQETLRDWELVLTPRGAAELREAETRVEAELSLVDFNYERARAAQDVGQTAEALRLLDAGCHLIEQYCPSMLRSLAAMSVLSRMVGAMAPVRPLVARTFSLRELAQLAYLNQFLHHFLVTTAERFRLRVHILARGFATLLRVVARSTQRAKLTRPAEPEWQRLEAARHDVRALSGESLESFRVLLLSISAERRTSS